MANYNSADALTEECSRIAKYSFSTRAEFWFNEASNYLRLIGQRVLAPISNSEDSRPRHLMMIVDKGLAVDYDLEMAQEIHLCCFQNSPQVRRHRIKL